VADVEGRRPTTSQALDQRADPAPPGWKPLLPSWKVTIAAAIAWASVLGLSAALSLTGQGWLEQQSILKVVAIFAAGGLFAFPLGWGAARILSARGRAEQRFAAAFVCFSIASVGATTGIYALDYRSYYAQWHDETFSMTWLMQFVFTTVGATLQFVVSGLPLYFPLGFAGLTALSLWFARQPR
jgi:hypothetical protein